MKENNEYGKYSVQERNKTNRAYTKDFTSFIPNETHRNRLSLKQTSQQQTLKLSPSMNTERAEKEVLDFGSQWTSSRLFSPL